MSPLDPQLRPQPRQPLSSANRAADARQVRVQGWLNFETILRKHLSATLDPMSDHMQRTIRTPRATSRLKKLGYRIKEAISIASTAAIKRAVNHQCERKSPGTLSPNSRISSHTSDIRIRIRLRFTRVHPTTNRGNGHLLALFHGRFGGQLLPTEATCMQT